MLDEPKTSKDYIYSFRDGSNIKYKGTPFNTVVGPQLKLQVNYRKIGLF